MRVVLPFVKKGMFEFGKEFPKRVLLGEFRRETFHVLGFFFQKAFRNEEREIEVLVAGGFEARIELALQHFPNGVAIRLDHHAAFDNFGGLGHVALEHDVLIPGCEILLSRCDWRFCH